VYGVGVIVNGGGGGGGDGGSHQPARYTPIMYVPMRRLSSLCAWRKIVGEVESVFHSGSHSRRKALNSFVFHTFGKS